MPHCDQGQLVRRWLAGTSEFAELAVKVDAGRRNALSVALDGLEEAGLELLGSEVGFEYRPGLERREGAGLSTPGGEYRAGPATVGNTQYGPHRADLKLSYDERRARKLVSRGQQKLLACAMVLAAAETAQTALETAAFVAAG